MSDTKIIITDWTI